MLSLLVSLASWDVPMFHPSGVTILRLSEFEVEKGMLASGSHAILRKALHRHPPVLLKIWRPTATLRKSSRQRLYKVLEKELADWTRMRHPNIAPLFGVVPSIEQEFALILPYYLNGNIVAYTSNSFQVDRFRLLQGVAAGLSYLHRSSPSIIHGDVRGVNILINDTGDAVLSDLGLSKLPFPYDKTCGGSETTRWMSPEMMDANNTNGATTCSDVYSFAMTWIEVYSQDMPFPHRTFYSSVIDDVQRGIRPFRPIILESDSFWDLITLCWAQNPSSRPSIDSVLSLEQ